MRERLVRVRRTHGVSLANRLLATGEAQFWGCFAYALAKHTREALLFKDNDFNHTDLYRVIGVIIGRTTATGRLT